MNKMVRNKILALWVHPRSLSTAFERMIMERGDFEVLHEPFSLLYYYIEKRADITYMHPDDNIPKTWEGIVNLILKKAEKRQIFFKDMAYHVIHHANETFLLNFINTFLVRDPEPTLLSHYKMNQNFTFEEAGYEAVYKLFKMVQKAQGKAPVVIDASKLENNPEEIVKKYCEAVNIPYLPNSLHWKPGEVEIWSTWKEWHLDTMKSDGFIKNMEEFNFGLEIDPKLAEYYRKSFPYYEELLKYSL